MLSKLLVDTLQYANWEDTEFVVSSGDHTERFTNLAAALRYAYLIAVEWSAPFTIVRVQRLSNVFGIAEQRHV